MRTTRVVVLIVFVVAWNLGGAGPATAHEEGQVVGEMALRPLPVHVYGQVGVGVVELVHLELGAFVGSRVSVEGMVAWDGVYGGRYGGGAYYTFGHAQGGRPPRNGLLVGARMMLDSAANFENQGEDLSSYGVIPVGYSFLSDSGFFLRATVGLAVVRERTSRLDGEVSIVEHHWRAGGPLFTVSAGFAF